jgi:ankyrin repeat protein
MQAAPQLHVVDLEDVRREIEVNPSLLHVPSHRGLTVLILAAGTSDPCVVEFLLDQGAPVDQRGQLGCTALLQACFTGRVEVAELLLRRGADATLATDNGKGGCHSDGYARPYAPHARGTTLPPLVW